MGPPSLGTSWAQRALLKWCYSGWLRDPAVAWMVAVRKKSWDKRINHLLHQWKMEVLWDVMDLNGVQPEMVVTNSLRTGKWPSRKFVDIPMKHSDLNYSYVKLPEGIKWGRISSIHSMISWKTCKIMTHSM